MKRIEITWEEITPRPNGGNYDIYHYGIIKVNGVDFEFTLCEMYNSNNDYTCYEVTWVNDTPENASELETAIQTNYENQ